LQRGLGEDQIKRSQKAREELLKALSEGSLFFSEILKKTRMSTATISKYLKIMEETGEVRKVIRNGRLAYALTPYGLKEIHKMATQVENEVIRKLHLYGAVLDLRKQRSITDIVVGAGLPAIKDIVRTFAMLRRTDREYLRFLAELYVHSVKKFIDKTEGELTYVELRAVWQVIDSNAWKEPVVKEGLHFDYINAWRRFYGNLSSELKRKMKERNLNEEKIFKKLRAFSFPASERIRLAKMGLI